jgi:membrane AbrB-like protein
VQRSYKLGAMLRCDRSVRDKVPSSALARICDAATIRLALALIGTFAAGLAGGFLARALSLPLPFMTGALLITAALGLAGVPVRSLWPARAAGQFVTGSAIGTQFTLVVIMQLVTLLPVILLAGVASVVVGAVGALILIRLAGVERKSAFFATMPAGVIEMANIASRQGADLLPITVLQTMRVGLTVSAAPFLVTTFAAGTQHEVAQVAVMSWWSVAVLAAGALIGGGTLAYRRMPNCWFLGSLAAAALMGAFGVVEGRVPDLLLIIAQVVIGISIGTQYRHEFLTTLLRLLLASLVTVPFALISMGLIAALCAHLLDLPVATMVLALAPAGMAEMALTGKVLGLDATLITGFQTVRILVTTLGAVPAYRLFLRLTGGHD